MPTTLVSVMYHYVRPPDPLRWGGVHPLSPEEFAAQLDELSALGPIVPASQAGTSGEPIEVVLTFDDGTQDQYAFAFPELKRRGLSALFAVMSGPAEGHVALIHLVHVLTSRLTDGELLVEIEARAGSLDLDDAELDRLYWRETTRERRAAKYALNFALPHEAALRIAAEVHEAQVGPVQELIDAWYLTAPMIREMAAAGMEFAVHCHRHVPLFDPVARYVEEEIAPCRDWLAGVVGRVSEHYIAPFGGQTASDASLADMQGLLEYEGFRHCHTVERGINPRYSEETFLIKRLDAADLPPRRPFPPEPIFGASGL